MHTNSHTKVALRSSRATIACIAAAAAVAVTGPEVVSHVRSIAEPADPAAASPYDLDANKAASMRVLNRYVAERQAGRVPRYDDIDANKARYAAARRP